MSAINKIFIIGVFCFTFSIACAFAQGPEDSDSDIVGTVKEDGGTWYAIAKTGKGKKKIYTKGDIFCSEISITHCLRIQDIKKDMLILKDVESKEIFTLNPGNRIPLESTDIIFERTITADVIEYRYNDAPGTKKGLVEDFTVNGLEKNKVIVKKDYDKTFLPEKLSEDEKELFRSPKTQEENPERIKASLFEEIEVEKIGKDSWAVNTEKAGMALNNIDKTIFSVIKSVEPHYRFGKGPSLKFDSELGDVVVNRDGFLVENLAVGKIIERSGVQEGDLIKSINSQPVNSLYGIYKAYMSVKSGGDIKIVNVDIIREGKQKTLTYKVR